MKTAAIYLRSSKDRKDMSPAAQRRKLRELAASKQITIVKEFTDVVISGRTENRPAFQEMLLALKDPKRGWSVILVMDTSRIARNQYVAHLFRHECRRREVEVVFSTAPDLDGVSAIMLPAVMHAMDEVHSYMSREKGLAGMNENVRAGFRAGGRAPAGYQLRKIATGAIRDGEAVTKSVLELDPDLSDAIAAYLRARVDGLPRQPAIAKAGLGDRFPGNTLIGIEWNALTYAGHTVWNVHASREGGAYVGGSKRRPRNEWVIQHNTHPALITETEAERLLSRLQAKAAARSDSNRAQRERDSDALLGGLLYAPDGAKWWAESDRYRMSKPAGPQRSITKALIEQPVIDQVLSDLASPDFAGALLASTKALLNTRTDESELTKLRREVSELAAKISKTMDMAAALDDPAPAIRKVNELEQRRAAKAADLEEMEADVERARKMHELTQRDVERALAHVIADARDRPRGELRETILALVERVVLDPTTLTATLAYRVAPVNTGVKVASPRGAEIAPRIAFTHTVQLQRPTNPERAL